MGAHYSCGSARGGVTGPPRASVSRGLRIHGSPRDGWAAMVACLLCSSPRSIGVLCTTHGVAIASPGITSEQIFSRVDAAGAALIDAWGIAHGVGDGTRI